MTPYSIKKHADLFGIEYRYAVKMRLRYLYDQIEMCCDWVEEKGDMPEVMFAEAIEEITRLSESLKRKPVASSITDEMIEEARAFPIEQLIPFERGVAIAWCHNDTKPSLTWFRKANRATCFPCGGKSYDSIAVLMERDGKTFQDAVRSLLI